MQISFFRAISDQPFRLPLTPFSLSFPLSLGTLPLAVSVAQRKEKERERDLLCSDCRAARCSRNNEATGNLSPQPPCCATTTTTGLCGFNCESGGGEWHFSPFAESQLSRRRRRQLQKMFPTHTHKNPDWVCCLSCRPDEPPAKQSNFYISARALSPACFLQILGGPRGGCEKEEEKEERKMAHHEIKWEKERWKRRERGKEENGPVKIPPLRLRGRFVCPKIRGGEGGISGRMNERYLLPKKKKYKKS